MGLVVMCRLQENTDSALQKLLSMIHVWGPINKAPQPRKRPLDYTKV